MHSKLFEEHHLVGKDVGRVPVVVVEIAQFRVQEARRSGRRDHPGGPDVGDVLPAAVHPALALLSAEGLLGALRHVVDHRIPDGPGVLRQVDVDTAELRLQAVQRQWPGVVHIEDGGDAVGEDQPGVADRSVGRGAQRDDHHVQIALGAAEAVLDGVLGLQEPMEAQGFQLPLEVGYGEVGQQDHGFLVDVFGEQSRIEVVRMQVRDVEVVAVT